MQQVRIGRQTLIFVILLLSVSTCFALNEHNDAITTPLRIDGRQALTVMSFNIRVGYGSRDPGLDPYTLSQRPENLSPIVGAIRSQKADIVGLQEVRGRRQARRLAAQLDMNYAYTDHDTGSRLPSWWGVAVLSSFPILEERSFLISKGKGNCKRALLCTLQIDGRPITVVTIHKDKDLKDGRSLAAIMQEVAPIRGPVVLIGDLNIKPFDRRLKILKKRFIDTASAVESATARQARSRGTFLGIGRIDYIWVDPIYFIVKNAGLVDRRFWAASDHLAYWAQIVPKHDPTIEK